MNTDKNGGGSGSQGETITDEDTKNFTYKLPGSGRTLNDEEYGQYMRDKEAKQQAALKEMQEDQAGKKK